MEKTLPWSRALAAIFLALLAGCAGTAGTVEDPQGRFSYQAAPELRLQPTDGPYAHYLLDSPPMQVYVLAVEAPDEQAGKVLAFQRIGRDFGALKLDSTTSFGPWRADSYRAGEGGRWAGLAYQYRGDSLYALVIFGEGDSSPDSLPDAVTRIIGSFRFGSSVDGVSLPASFAELEAYIQRTAASFGGSISVAAAADGRVVYRFAAGDRGRGLPADPGVAYHWGSISKIATAIAVMQQVEQGRLELDAALEAWFPEFPLAGRITVRELLSHSAGLPDAEYAHLVAFGENRMPEVASVLAGYWPRVRELAYEPGSRSVYHNWNFLVLARLVEKASGEPFTSYVRRHVFAPAGLEHTAYTSGELAGAAEALAVVKEEVLSSTEAVLAGNGIDTEGIVASRSGQLAHLQPFDILPCWAGVKSTAADAALLGWLFLNDGQGAAGRVLAGASVHQMLKMQESPDGRPLGMGLAWHLGRQGRESFAEHAGGAAGVETLLRIYPRRGLSIAVLGNMNGYGPGKVLEYTAALLGR
jgi:CubicO group peptidase (beta-lactamase class C family)